MGFSSKEWTSKQNTHYLGGSGTEGSDPGGGLVVEKFFPKEKIFHGLWVGPTNWELLGKVSPTNISLPKVLGVLISYVNERVVCKTCKASLTTFTQDESNAKVEVAYIIKLR